MRQDELDIRFAEAITLGVIADSIFADHCRARGLEPARCLDAPLAHIITTPKDTSGSVIHVIPN